MLAIGAHPDDIEIGAGGTLLSLAESQPGLRVRYVVLTGTAERQLEARQAADAFLPGADVTVDCCDLPEGRLPAAWGQVKDALEEVAAIVRARPRHRADSAAMRTRTTGPIGEIVPTVFRDQLYLGMRSRNGTATSAGRRCISRCRPRQRPAQGGAAAQVLPVSAKPRLVG